MQILSRKTMNGALTFILIDLVKRFGEITYGRLLDCMQEDVQRANKKGCLPCVFFRKLFEYKQIQVIYSLPFHFFSSFSTFFFSRHRLLVKKLMNST